MVNWATTRYGRTKENLRDKDVIIPSSYNNNNGNNDAGKLLLIRDIVKYNDPSYCDRVRLSSQLHIALSESADNKGFLGGGKRPRKKYDPKTFPRCTYKSPYTGDNISTIYDYR